MRILKPGMDEYKGRCPECGCEFVYCRQDVIRSPFGSVICPHCSTRLSHHGVVGCGK